MAELSVATPYGEASGSIQGIVPVQGFGSVRGTLGEPLHWYFRARGNAWEMSVGHEHPEVVEYVDETSAIWSASGGWGAQYEAGYMDADVAVRVAAEALERYLRGEARWDAPADLHRATP